MYLLPLSLKNKSKRYKMEKVFHDSQNLKIYKKREIQTYISS